MVNRPQQHTVLLHHGWLGGGPLKYPEYPQLGKLDTWPAEPLGTKCGLSPKLASA